VLTIYGIYRSRTSRTFWLADELGLAFTHVPVIPHDRAADAAAVGANLTTQSPEFLKLNPNGRIPTIDDDGLMLNESLAINLYLARKHGGPLAPRNVAEEGEMGAWSLWAATTVEPHSINVVYHRVRNPKGPKDPRIADAAVEALRAPFAVLDGALAKNGWVVGGRFTVADINVAEIVRYAEPAPELFDAAPRVKDWLAACHARPAFKAMMKRRMAEPG
jgi:glutathione S-transferase